MIRERFNVSRRDQEDGTIIYEVWDNHPDSYTFLFSVSDEDDFEEDAVEAWPAKKIAEITAKALNQWFKEEEKK